MPTAKERATAVLTAFRQFWDKQDKKRKILYISLLVLAVVAAVVITLLVNRKDYVVLYEGLESSEAAEIAQIIEDAGFEATVSGGTVTVVKGTEDQLTMTLAQQGYPKSNLTYDLYTSKVGMFTTESEKLEYSRMALESRLSAIIGSLENVDKATVTLSLPKQKNTVIAAYQADPTASVVVYLKGSSALSSSQIHGINHIVQMSVAGLKEENISIVDGNGVLLLADETNIDVIAEETRKLKFKTDLENQIKAKIIELLEPAYNEDGFSVAVNIVLNFDDKVSEDTKYTPSTEDERGMLEHSKSESATGYATAEGGVVGVEGNADDTYPTGDTNGNGSWSETSSENNYLVNTYKEQIEKVGAKIESLSISTIIYTDYLPDATKLELRRTIGNAASINPEVVDNVVSIMALPRYEDTLQEEDEQKVLFGLTLKQLIILGAAILVLLIILILIFVMVSRNAKKQRKKFERELLAANMAGESEPLVESFLPLSETATTGSTDIPSLISGEDENSKDFIIRRELTAFARQSPEIVAQLLRTWMNEEAEQAQQNKKKKQPKEGEQVE